MTTDPLSVVGADDPAQLSLRKDIATFPVDATVDIPEPGRYGAVRTSASQGACGIHDYPCTHWGVDIPVPGGTAVVAPHDGWILYSGPADAPPFVGYRPGVVLIAHADSGDSMWSRIWKGMKQPLVKMFDFPENPKAARYSLLAHVHPLKDIAMPSDMMRDDGGEQFRKLDDGTLVMTDHARAWIEDMMAHSQVPGAAGGGVNRWVHTGETVALSDATAGHVHWEIRTRPLGGKGYTVDPFEMFRLAYGKTPDLVKDLATSKWQKIKTASRRGGDGAGALILLGLLLLASNKSRR